MTIHHAHPPQINAFDFRGREVDPRAVIETIVAKYPHAGAERWFRIFESVVAEHPRLRQLIIQREFSATLLALSAAAPPQP
jgi:hypothetical protein